MIETPIPPSSPQLQSLDLRPSGGTVVSIDDILVDDTGGGNGNNGEDEPNDIAAKVNKQMSIRFWLIDVSNTLYLLV